MVILTHFLAPDLMLSKIMEGISILNCIPLLLREQDLFWNIFILRRRLSPPDTQYSCCLHVKCISVASKTLCN